MTQNLNLEVDRGRGGGKPGNCVEDGGIGRPRRGIGRWRGFPVGLVSHGYPDSRSRAGRYDAC